MHNKFFAANLGHKDDMQAAVGAAETRGLTCIGASK